jgi:predicted Zn-dependent protease
VVVQSAEAIVAQPQNYELLLQREPNNQLALEKLSIIRLNSGDDKGAITLMEKLLKLHPDRQDYKTVLRDVKKRLGEVNQGAK